MLMAASVMGNHKDTLHVLGNSSWIVQHLTGHDLTHLTLHMATPTQYTVHHTYSASSSTALLLQVHAERSARDSAALSQQATEVASLRQKVSAMESSEAARDEENRQLKQSLRNKDMLVLSMAATSHGVSPHLHAYCCMAPATQHSQGRFMSHLIFTEALIMSDTIVYPTIVHVHTPIHTYAQH